MVSEMMMAVRLHAFGGPDVLRYEEAPRPAIGPGEVLVRVHAAGINPPDLYLRDGYRTMPPEWQPHPAFPIVIGTDVSGVVEAMADDVTGFAIGDEVFAMVRFPEDLMKGSDAYAQYVRVAATELALKPAGIDHAHAGAAPMSLLTAWQFLIELGHDAPNPFQSFRHEPVPLADKTVVVNGAGGGVGHLLVQLAKWQGAHVIAIASGKNAALMRDLHVDRFVDYTKEAAEEVIDDADLVVDAVGGANMERFLRILKPGGALFLVNPLGFAGYGEAYERGITVSSTQVRSNGAQLEEAARLLDDGTVRVVVDSSFPLADAAAAHARTAKGGIQGKIVLDVA
ncbi:NADP-dependent oxidoreductase [Sphingomonas ginsenosidivorax]|uniref:NADP-dependent oxidoreductase n=2 Tax=Sphingomonas ginsenosidivorax TaxID=862135 RepID=A0A5C6UJ95_9SPHN|nr:NADP-dependent oxidoreductase [Sphingomonas ginsenosidivorax]